MTEASQPEDLNEAIAPTESLLVDGLPWPPLPTESGGVPARLEWLAGRVGSKRKLAELAEISEAQL